MMDQWPPAIVFLALSAIVPISMVVAARFLAVHPIEDVEAKRDTYECGEDPDGVAWMRFHPRYYLVALVFVLFDVETAFLLPWAMGLEDFGGFGIVEMFIFLGILMLGWAYALRKGALKWQ
ncbi:MAG: NADH-quinone oxidoreductase subunit A [Myxococcota bacterium]|nr:NADH-quinone oxidoreductase subunit A [Myxococcota bacterium]